MADIYGSEEGWRAASFDSRRHQKQAAIKALVDRQIACQAAVTKEWEDSFENDLIEAAGPVVHAGLERAGSTVGFSRKYAANFDKVFGGK